ncbi:cell wall-binding repeat-containing protein [Planococcus maritimus]|uniref:Cell wall-binding repeat-containing protein n=1 Tax=Planococcus maritimus TaxID=192421 RepID=A0A7D7MHA2_PLAMR|nr:cell wall-binding repeat-containing protein [Planococcus maritimus]QMT18070.1 cell wall-binding repeat-containing protein [Planococcus maritimus]
MYKSVKSSVLALTLAASGVIAPLQSSANENYWAQYCDDKQQFYEDESTRYVCEEEPNDDWRDAKEIILQPSYGDRIENKRMKTLVGNSETATSNDWWKVIIPKERGYMQWGSVSDVGQGVLYILDEKTDTLMWEPDYTKQYGRYDGNVYYYNAYKDGSDTSYAVDIEFRANPIEENPHEPNDYYSYKFNAVEYATVKNGELTNSTWSDEYDSYDNFVIESKATKGRIDIEVNYSDYEFSRWKGREAYIPYMVLAEKMDGTWEVIYNKTVMGMANQTYKIGIDVNEEDLSGKFLLRLKNSNFFDKNYSFEMSFAAEVDDLTPEPPTEPEIPDEPSEQVFKRFDGKDRYDTNKLMNQDIEDGTLDHVIVASGRNFPDALAGGALTNIKNGTIVLVNDRDAVIEKTTNEIERMLKPKGKVLILGSDSVVSEKMVEKLEQQEIATQRIYGSTRIETAIEIAEEVNEDPSEIFLVDGFNFADALSIAPVSAKLNQPILMTKKQDKLPDSVVTYLDESNIKTVTIIGGTLAVGSPIEADLEAEGYTVNRISGSTRTETSLAVAKAYYPNASAVGIANGWQFPDALSGSAFAYRNNMPVILTSDKRISSSNLKWIKEDSKSVYFMGGISPLPKSLESEF